MLPNISMHLFLWSLEEVDDKAEGEAALNEMFQKIYADASDEVSVKKDRFSLSHFLSF